MIKLGSTKIGEMYVGSTKIGSAYLGSNLVYQYAAPGPVIEWDTWDRTTYDDTSWQSTLTKDGSVGTVTISKASQFINFGANVNTFYGNNSLSTLNVELTKHFRFNDTSSLTNCSTVYSTLSNGVKAQSSANGFMVIDSGRNININGNGHVIQGLYCYTTNNHNGGSFLRFSGGNGGTFSLNNLTFDRCLFRSNSQASSAFSMLSAGTKFVSNYLNFNKCAVASESTAQYQCIMFGFLNSTSSTEYNHTQISFYGCGFKGSMSWSDYSCGCGGISNWSSTPTFKAIWNNATYINPIRLGGNGTMKLYAGNRASTTYNGTCSYYNVGSGITAQGTGLSSANDCITTFNNTVSNQDYILVLDDNDNLYHKVEI